jgi:hypothetical protein
MANVDGSFLLRFELLYRQVIVAVHA